MIRQVSSHLQIKAINELNEVPERVQEDLEKLREWLKKQPHLCVRDDDQILLTFLRACKFSLQDTKNKIDFYYTAKTLVPEFYANRDPMLPEIQNVLNAGCFYVLPEPDNVSARIILSKAGDCNPDSMSFTTLMKVSSMFLEILMIEDDNAAISGITIWMEAKNGSVKYSTQFTPTVAKKSIKVIEKGSPFRIKGIHITSCPPVLEFCFNLAKSIFTGKMMKRMHLYQNYDEFYSVIPKKLLPKEYGGENGSLSNLKAEWKKKIESYREWFLEDSKYGSNEALRPSEAKTFSDVFGVEGSFRKLTID